ncbi:MAG: DUF1553 domain-containing protein [Pirellulaceae bacterium]|nr:DUF1553 domain-containing protein [Planctomycetales bacterium]
MRDSIFLGLCIAGGLALATYISPREYPPSRVSLENWQDWEDVREIAARIDEEFSQAWAEAGLQSAELADDLTVARRMSLGMTGTIPSLEEIRALESLSPEARIPWWTEHLLADRRSSDYRAERWGRALVGVEGGPFLIYRRRRFISWLSDQLHANVPYDELARTLITAEGVWTDSPAVNFLTVTANPEDGNRPDAIRLAARTSRAFLGVRLDCVQCHDDNLGGPWKQSDFHELAAFYAGVRNSAFGVRNEHRDYEYKYLGQDESITIAPQTPFADDLLNDTPASQRMQLASWVTHSANRAFARAAVNRVWAMATGKPLVEPIDSIPLSGPYPPGLETLADDFVMHGYDLKRLWRIIAMTKVYRRESRANFEVTREHEQAWAVFPVTRLRAEQVAGGLWQSARLKTVDAHSHIVIRLAHAAETSEFIRSYGDAGEDEFSPSAGTIPQRLVLMNGKLVRDRTKQDLVGNAATRIAMLLRDDQRAVEAAYLIVLTRRPTTAELDHFHPQLASATAVERPERIEDIVWTLLNSTEFSWNH